jgi:tellurite resistance protein
MVEQAEPKLRRDVFVALAAVAWADGKLDPDEADAIVRAAVDEGLPLEEIAEIESATKTKVDLGALFVYAIACWIARLDGQVTPAEATALAGLGEKLGIPERPRAHAEAAAREVAEMPEGDRPARYDLVALRRILGERLRTAQAATGRTTSG